jgi:hypothetical protein
MYTGVPFADVIVICPEYMPGDSPVGSAVMLTVAGVDLVVVSDFSQELEVVSVNRTLAPIDVTLKVCGAVGVTPACAVKANADLSTATLPPLSALNCRVTATVCVTPPAVR